MKFGRFGLVGLSALAGAAIGCQEIVGIQPWDAGQGGALGTTSSAPTTTGTTTTGVSATTAVSGSGSSSSSGTPCLMNCLGGPCVDGACGPYEKDIPAVTSAFIRALPNQIVVATVAGPPGGAWTITSVDKFLAHDLTTVTTAPAIRALSSADADSVYFASADGIFLRRLSSQTDDALTDTAAKNVIMATGLERVAFSATQEICWVHASDSPTAGGIYCTAPTMLAQPVQRAQFSYGGRLVGDGTLAYAIQSVGASGAGIVSAMPGSQMGLKTVPWATDLAVDDTHVYAITSQPQELIAIEKADPNGLQLTQILGQSPTRLVRFGSWLYVLFTSAGVIRRYESKTLAEDPTFALYTGGYPVDFAVDGDGVYWVGIGSESTIGILAHHNDP